MEQINPIIEYFTICNEPIDDVVYPRISGGLIKLDHDFKYTDKNYLPETYNIMLNDINNIVIDNNLSSDALMIDETIVIRIYNKITVCVNKYFLSVRWRYGSQKSGQFKQVPPDLFKIYEYDLFFDTYCAYVKNICFAPTGKIIELSK